MITENSLDAVGYGYSDDDHFRLSNKKAKHYHRD